MQGRRRQESINREQKPATEVRVEHDKTVIPTCQTGTKPGALSLVAESVEESGKKQWCRQEK